jgi:hypothetical protein
MEMRLSGSSVEWLEHQFYYNPSPSWLGLFYVLDCMMIPWENEFNTEKEMIEKWMRNQWKTYACTAMRSLTIMSVMSSVHHAEPTKQRAFASYANATWMQRRRSRITQECVKRSSTHGFTTNALGTGIGCRERTMANGTNGSHNRHTGKGNHFHHWQRTDSGEGLRLLFSFALFFIWSVLLPNPPMGLSSTALS